MSILPKAMREPISLGYLLARASDTLADSEELEASLRAEMLGGFKECLTQKNRETWLKRVEQDVVPCQKHEGEKKLMQSMRDVFAWLDSLLTGQGEEAGVDTYSAPGTQETLGKRQHTAILTVMEHILRGQTLDIERFELRDDFRFRLDTELEEYCYLVAGCVGEFWTEIGVMSLGNFSKVETVRMNRWGGNYGKGLQLINILRDLPNDLKGGRCYLPGADISDQDQLMLEAARWRQRARDYLKDGEAYTDALVLRRTRMATALPGLIGVRTLDLLDEADWKTMEQGVKVSRGQVYRSAWEAFLM